MHLSAILTTLLPLLSSALARPTPTSTSNTPRNDPHPDLYYATICQTHLDIAYYSSFPDKWPADPTWYAPLASDSSDVSAPGYPKIEGHKITAAPSQKNSNGFEMDIPNVPYQHAPNHNGMIEAGPATDKFGHLMCNYAVAEVVYTEKGGEKCTGVYYCMQG